jgi:hypothetical protein
LTLTKEIMDTKPTSKMFQEPLIKTLGELSGFKANRPVEFNSTYTPLCQAFGITLDQFGIQEQTGIPWVGRWIQVAFKEITDAGFGVRIGRGQWALSEIGLQKALILAGVQSQVVEQMNKVEIDTATISVTPPVVPALSLAVGPNNNPDKYHNDPYIRFLALQESACKGFYSEQSGICSDCSIQNACKNVKAAEFSNLARMLEAEDKAALAPANPVIDNPVSSPNVDTSNREKATGGTAQKIICQAPAICACCSTPIPKGENCYWVRFPDGAKKLYHLNCYEPVQV